MAKVKIRTLWGPVKMQSGDFKKIFHRGLGRKEKGLPQVRTRRMTLHHRSPRPSELTGATIVDDLEAMVMQHAQLVDLLWEHVMCSCHCLPTMVGRHGIAAMSTNLQQFENIKEHLLAKRRLNELQHALAHASAGGNPHTPSKPK